MSAVGTSVQYYCGDPERRRALRDAIKDEGRQLNGINFLEVLDRDLKGTPLGDRRQRVLLVQCVSGHGLAGISKDNVRIDGGVRVGSIGVRYAHRLADIEDAGPEDVLAEERIFLASYRAGELDPATVVVVSTDRLGDYSQYRLSLVETSGDPAPPLESFDPRLYSVEFSFKVECANDLDCKQDTTCPPTVHDEPGIDYLAKDYHSFRQLMLDRLSTVAPDWKESSPADLGVTLVELLAYVGDQLSYLQDAVATESYLGTARRRISVRRHARLVDYFIGEGTNARTWVVLKVGVNADEQTLPKGTALLTRCPGRDVVVAIDELDDALSEGALYFETMHDIILRAGDNTIDLHTWSDQQCCLPVGATSATLRAVAGEVAIGDFLLFEEVLGPTTGQAADADPAHRHVVRVIEALAGMDPVENVEVLDVRWHPADALPFPLCVAAWIGDSTRTGISVARRNVVLVDHGKTVSGEVLEPVPENARVFRPLLRHGPLTHAYAVATDVFPDKEFDADTEPVAIPPAAELTVAPESGAPEQVVHLNSSLGETWEARRDLLGSDGFRAEFVAEIENDGRARLRFGDGASGRAPIAGTEFTAHYRVGNGVDGNVGHDSIVHIVRNDGLPALFGEGGISQVRNPLAATGGAEPEALNEARQYAPQTFRVQERAVTADDYAEVALRFRRRSAGPTGSEVQRAAARFRWTGSWHTAFITVDRRDGHPIDDEFVAMMRGYLGRFRMAGTDLEIDQPRFAALDLKLRICVAHGHSRSDVKQDLLETFGTQRRADGTIGFFHPDNWTFAQSVHLSRIYEAAARVAGVDSVVVERLQRYGAEPAGEIDDGVLSIGRFEIARLDNNPSLRENGVLELVLEGGR